MDRGTPAQSAMKISSLLLFLTGAAAGALGGYFLRGNDASTESQTRVVTLEKELASLKEAKAKPTATPAPKKAEMDIHAEVVKLTDTPAENALIKQQQEKMAKAMKDRKSLKVSERLAALKARLGLTDAQTEALRKVLTDHMKDGSEWMANQIDEKEAASPTEELARVTALLKGPDQKELDSKVLALLSPEQQQAYSAFQAEQQANKIEIKVNKELARMQNSMSLTNEQKDKVFSTLSQIAAEEGDSAPSGLAALAGLLQQSGNADAIKTPEMDQIEQSKKRRSDAMREILSPEQFEIYDAQQKQSNMAELMEQMMSDLPAEVFIGGVETQGAISIQAEAAPEVTPAK